MPHMVDDPASGARTEDKHCPECGQVTLHEWVRYEGDRGVGERDEWLLVCRGQSRETFAAGK